MEQAIANVINNTQQTVNRQQHKLQKDKRILTTLSTETPSTSVFNFSNSPWRSLKAVISTRREVVKVKIQLENYEPQFSLAVI